MSGIKSKPSATLEQVLGALEKVKKTGDGYIARCPAHDDKNPSLSIKEKQGKVLLHCHAGCSYEDIMSTSELGVVLSSASSGTEAAPSPEPDWNKFFERKPDHIYRYKTVGGGLLGFVCRFDNPDGSKSFTPVWHIPDHAGKLTWQKKAAPLPRPLYGQELLARHPNKPVLVVEGEKAADAARKRKDLSDYVVVTWPGGANAYAKADWTPLKGRSVVIWPDNDTAGRQAAHGISRILKAMED